jgi:hypothetical protein
MQAGALTSPSVSTQPVAENAIARRSHGLAEERTMRRRLGDRRGRPRFEIVGELWGSLETAVAMSLLNVGRGGALVQSPVSLTPEAVHRVLVSYAGTKSSASVQVRHVRPVVGADGREYFLIGLEFLGVPEMLLAQIDAWIGGGEYLLPGGV